jgi:membrane protease YdiL (CAAX protease family)
VNRRASKRLQLRLTVALAAVLWFVTFYLHWSNFWIKISLSAAALAGLATLLQGRLRLRAQLRFEKRAVLRGLLSAAILYGVFWAGKQISLAFFAFAPRQIHAIYDIGQGTPGWFIFLLLGCVTGPCEEIYWRGYLQRNLMHRLGSRRGWLAATAIYAGVHIWSFNFILVGAAAVAGAFWGAMYRRSGNLVPVIISHALWSAVTFTVLPLS